MCITLDLMSTVPTPQVGQAQGFFANLSPLAFRKWARQYYECAVPLLSSAEFSPVPYFLLCRAIELVMKAEHLETKRQPEVKKEFVHFLVKSYEALPTPSQVLSTNEIDLLKQADEIYSGKGFEYFNPQHALEGYSRYPDLAALGRLARKLLGYEV